ncbi:glucoamylase family protein [Paludisphaera borealis]|uniref:Uncharacterized protein n=1 Tax=Paludisphaera borealis TaxID=1387353 RepID=A0A1U7CMW2_9BACT|nr:glucoamylase family protein [Paludisphaera borealis]APW60272.1 putative (alpha/alpha)-barrel-type glycoside hydrolase of unknown function [Paludisphaera borealis]
MARSPVSPYVVGLFGMIVGLFGSSNAHGQPTASSLAPADRAVLKRYAEDAWRSMDRLTQPSGLPADRIHRKGEGWDAAVMETSPTNIASYIWSVMAAEQLEIIPHDQARDRLTQTIVTLERMNRPHGFFINDIDPRDGARLLVSPVNSQPRRPLLSSVDNAWLAVALTMVVNTQPELAPAAAKLLEAMDFGFFYDSYDPARPVQHPGLLHVGYWTDENAFFGHYGMLNSEARIASYLAIARGQLPAEQYYRMYRTLPTDVGPQFQTPTGERREYLGVPVFEGAYNYQGTRIVPSWGGSMFEALMVTLFVPEASWAPRSWGVNHPLYVRAQIVHGLQEMQYGFWGFSPAFRPAGGYEVYGVNGLGTNPDGYYSYEIGWGVPMISNVVITRTPHGIVTPHASFLALRFARQEAMTNLQNLKNRFPSYGALGFQDSVDVTAGLVSGFVLALDQGMILAAITNELSDDYMQRAFTTGAVERIVRPLIAQEEFTAGAPGQFNRAGRPEARFTEAHRIHVRASE